MTTPVLSVLALVLCLALSMSPRLNVGFVAMLLAYGVGVGRAGLRPQQVAAGFPGHMFITVLALTLLFGHARHNGTLLGVASRLLRLGRGNVGAIPVIFFFLAAALATFGAGNIGAVALLSPVAMAVAGEAGVPAFLMALCVATGGNAAALSPLSPTGVIAGGILSRIGLGHAAWRCYASVFVAHALIGLSGYLLLGGLRLLQKGRQVTTAVQPTPFGGKQVLTLLVIAAVFLLVVVLRLDVGAAALLGALLLSLCRAGEDEAAVRLIPFGTLIMVCGMMTLISVLERSGGLELISQTLSTHASRRSLPFVLGLTTGGISAYSSSAGVVLPAFLPMVPGLSQRLGADPLALASSINVGAHLVDVSPLSTLGALCLAHAAPGVDKGRLYRQLLMWGLAMAGVGALYCQVAFGWLWR